jgi:carbonic anhydrase/acetyltransferase-like protein (isoleucine patch superfamily)
MITRSFDHQSPRVGQRVLLTQNAVLVGEVTVGDDVSIWYGAVLRADLNPIVIGARSNIQDNAVLHVDRPDSPTIVGEDVTVGHAAILHGCRVERGALVGMHATVLNGAVVGEEAMVAAHALVPPGMVVPPRTLVAGVPAKIRREMTEDEVEHIRRGVRVYLDLKNRYLAAEGASDVPGEEVVS